MSVETVDADPTSVAESAIAFLDDDVEVRAQVATTALVELRGLIMRTGGPDDVAEHLDADPLDDLTFRAWHRLRDGRLDGVEPSEPVTISCETAAVALRELAMLCGPTERAPAPRRALQRTAIDELVDVLLGAWE